MTEAEREAFIEGAMWAREELAAELTEEELAELLTRGLMPTAEAFRMRATDASKRRESDA
jgi:hypothetical protein